MKWHADEPGAYEWPREETEHPALLVEEPGEAKWPTLYDANGEALVEKRREVGFGRWG